MKNNQMRPQIEYVAFANALRERGYDETAEFYDILSSLASLPPND
jgi:hypothetical protein